MSISLLRLSFTFCENAEIFGVPPLSIPLSDPLESAAYLAAIVDSSDDAIISKDLSGVIKSWNNGAQETFGYTAEEAIGQPILLLIPSNLHHEESTILARLRQGQRIEHYETIRRRKDGQLIDVSLTVSPVKNEKGEIIGASKIARDITGQKQATKTRRTWGDIGGHWRCGPGDGY